MPLMVISVICFIASPKNINVSINKTKLSYVDLAKDDNSKYLINSLLSKYDLMEKSEDDLSKSIKANKASFGIIINSTEPYVTIYKGSNADDTMLRNDINLYMASKDVPPILNIKEKNITVNNSYNMVLCLIINFCLFSSIYVAQEMHSLKQKKLLKRLFSTSNSEREIVGSIFICFLITLSLQFLMFNIVVYLITKTLLIPDVIGAIALFLSYVFISISLGLIVSRICASSSAIPGVINAILLPLGVISGTFMPRSFLPDIVQKISFLAPQYWFYNGVEKLAQNNLLLILPNVCVLILISIALFLISTIKSINFVE